METIIQGDIKLLIEDICLNLTNMKKAGITRERAFAQLRSNSVRQLGEVKRLYFEAGGTFTLIRQNDIIPALPILPAWDKEYQKAISEISDELRCEVCSMIQTITPSIKHARIAAIILSFMRSNKKQIKLRVFVSCV